MPAIESMSQSEFEEIRDGLKRWLESKQDEYENSEIKEEAYLLTEILLQEVEYSSLKNLLPWEDGD